MAGLFETEGAQDTGGTINWIDYQGKPTKRTEWTTGELGTYWRADNTQGMSYDQFNEENTRYNKIHGRGAFLRRLKAIQNLPMGYSKAEVLNQYIFRDLGGVDPATGEKAPGKAADAGEAAGDDAAAKWLERMRKRKGRRRSMLARMGAGGNLLPGKETKLRSILGTGA